MIRATDYTSQWRFTQSLCFWEVSLYNPLWLVKLFFFFNLGVQLVLMPPPPPHLKTEGSATSDTYKVDYIIKTQWKETVVNQVTAVSQNIVKYNNITHISEFSYDLVFVSVTLVRKNPLGVFTACLNKINLVALHKTLVLKGQRALSPSWTQLFPMQPVFCIFSQF